MTIALGCLLFILAMPFLLIRTARRGAVMKTTIGDPRAYDAALVGWKRRCYLAHLNSYEAAIGFVAAVLLGEFTHAPRVYLDSLAVAFTVLRVLYVYVYIADHAYSRNVVFQAALYCNLAMFLMAAYMGHKPA